MLRKVLPKKVYEHFLALTVGISILLDSNNEKRTAYLDYAQSLLTYYVHTSKHIYSELFVVYNVHCLSHLTEDVNNFQCSLNKISSFPFENHLQVIKRLVRNAKNPIVQVAKRLTEIEKSCVKQTSEKSELTYRLISCRKKDSCFMLYNEDFAFVKEKREDGMLICDIIKQRDADNFFIHPCESKLINIVCIRDQTRRVRKLLEKADLYRKVVCLPYSRGHVLLPLLHGVEKF